MPRKRQLDPQIWTSYDFSSRTVRQRLLFIGLISLADDEGRGRADAGTVKLGVFPQDPIRLEEVTKDLRAIDRAGMIHLYQVAGKAYYLLPTWTRYQKIDHPSRSSTPAPPQQKRRAQTKDLSKIPRDGSPNAREPSRQVSEEGRVGEGRSTTPPTPTALPEAGTPASAGDPAGGVTPRQAGTNPRAKGIGPRAVLKSLRAIGTNPRRKRAEAQRLDAIARNTHEAGDSGRNGDSPTIRARLEGQAAGLRGDGPDANGYPEGSEERRCWENGRREAAT